MQKLLNDYGHLCRAAASRFAWLAERDPAVTGDDLQQIAFIGLVKSAKTYNADNSGGKTFAGWAWWHVGNEIKRALRPVRNDSLDEPFDEDGTTLMDALPDESCPASDANLLTDEVVQMVRAAVDDLPDDQREVTRLHGLAGYTLQQCDELRDTEPGVSKKLNGRAFRALAKDKRLRDLVRDLDAETVFIRRKGVVSFFSTGTSTVEDVVLWRLDRQQWKEVTTENAEL